MDDALAGLYEAMDVYECECECEDECDCPDYDFLDMEPESLTDDELADWWHAWSGKPDASVADFPFEVFARAGDGSYIAHWLVRPDQPAAAQPVVFLGSEGDTGVAARDCADFLWLLAAGYDASAGCGPVAPHDPMDPFDEVNPQLAAIAERHAGPARKSAREVIVAAHAEFPDFASVIETLLS